MDVFVANEQDLPVDEARAGALARHVLVAEEVDDAAELSILYVSSDHIRLLNKRFAKNDYATDVLSFPLHDDPEEEDPDGYMLGDVVICPAVAHENAEKVGHPLADELDLLLVHGTLHLLGYDHQRPEEKARMDARINEVLATYRSEVTS